MGQVNYAKGNDVLNKYRIYPDYKSSIIDLLKKEKSGLTIADITKRIGTTRHTVSLILAELRGANLIDIRKVGVAKLHNWRDDNVF